MSDKGTYVSICVPSTGTWMSESAVHISDIASTFLCGAKKYTPRTCSVRAFDGCNLAQNRQELVKSSIDMGATHIMFLDADIMAPKNVIETLLEHDRFIVAANYPKRQIPIVGTSVDLEGKDITTTENNSGLQEVRFAPTGCMLIKTEVFKNIEYPWFWQAWISDMEKFCTEDVYFCARAKKAGYSVYIDHDLSKEIYHIGKMQFNFMEVHTDGNEQACYTKRNS